MDDVDSSSGREAGVDAGRSIRQRRSSDERTGQLRKQQQKLVEDRVKEILKGDPEIIAIDAEIEQLRGEIHLVRLNLTKKGGKLRNLLAQAEDLRGTLQKFHNREKDAIEAMGGCQLRRTRKDLLTTIRVRRELGLADLDLKERGG